MKKLLTLFFMCLAVRCVASTVYPNKAGEQFVLNFGIKLDSPVVSTVDGSTTTVGEFSSANFPEINLIRIILDGEYLNCYIGDGQVDDSGEYGYDIEKNPQGEGMNEWPALIGTEYDTDSPVKIELGWYDESADWDDPASEFHLAVWSDIFTIGSIADSKWLYETHDIDHVGAFAWKPTIFYTDEEIIPVPEPSITSLAILGACAILLKRK